MNQDCEAVYVDAPPRRGGPDCRISRYECIRRVCRREKERETKMESMGGVETRVDRTPCGGVADGYLGVDSDTPPRIGNRMTPSNSQSRVKVSAGRDLVSKSAMLLAEET